jgi:GntR family transcriptional regulator
MAEVFPTTAGQECLLTEKSYFAGKALAIWIRDAIPRSNLKRQDFDDPLAASLFELMANHGIKKVDHAVVEIVAETKRADAGTKLDLGECEPFTRLHESHFSSAGLPLAFSLVDVDNSFITFQVFRRA